MVLHGVLWVVRCAGLRGYAQRCAVLRGCAQVMRRTAKYVLYDDYLSMVKILWLMSSSW